MKKVKFIIFCCLLSLSAFCQNFTIVYEVNAKYSEEILEELPILALDVNRYRYSLQLNSQKSVFSRDSLMISNPYSESRVEIWQLEQIFKNHRTDKWLKTSGAYIDGHGYERKISELIKNNNFNWKKTDVKKEILGFKCIEVLDGGKKAYYAIDIPISDGPKYGIFGLPGLVLEYEDKSGHWKAVAINYSESREIIIPKLKTTSTVSEIKMSVFDLKSLPSNKAIRVDKSTAINEWIKFKD